MDENKNEKVIEDSTDNKNIKQKFPFLLFIIILFFIGLGFLLYQTKGHYEIASIPNNQIDKMLKEENKDRVVRLSIHSGEERIAFLIDEKQRKNEYQGDFHLQLKNEKGEYSFDSQYYSDKIEDVLVSGFYKRFILTETSEKIKIPEIENNIVKYALLGEKENISTQNGIETTFTHELNGMELNQIILLKDFSFKNTIYEKWYNTENDVRLKLIPDSEEFPDFRKSVEEFLLFTDLDKATLYATFLDNKLLTWGIDFNFSYKEDNQVLKEWKVYLDLTYEKNDTKIKREKLDIINSTNINNLMKDVYDFDKNPYLDYDGKIESNKEVTESDIGELDISLEELDDMLMNGSSSIKK